MQASIVALYGPKTDAFGSFLTDCQDTVAEIIGPQFRRYEIDQVHGTLIGLERDASHRESFRNLNYWQKRRVDVAMDFDGLLGFLREVVRLPFQIQIGGFEDRDYPFASRAQRAYDRSFSVQGSNVVLVGWPLKNSALSTATGLDESVSYPDVLHRIRQGAQGYGVLHAYHSRPDDVDNDFFLRLGVIADADFIEANALQHLHDLMRRVLASHSPHVVTIDLSDLCVAFYESPELPITSTRVFSLSDEHLTGELIQQAYSLP